MKKFTAVRVGLRARMDRFGSQIKNFLRRNGGRIAYYGLVVLALCAIARAAEIYRGGGASDVEQMVLPAADIQLPAEPEESGPVFRVPEALEVIRGFSNVPEWRSDLGLWETHPAVDYALDGGDVPCLCGGVVRTVGESGVYGGFVEIDCDGLLMRYASIVPSEAFAPGMEVELGERIGAMDASMPGEAHLGAHLHLELWVDGDATDFAGYASKNRPGTD